MSNTSFQLQQQGDTWVGHFNAMACPCEILVDSPDQKLAAHLTHIACNEALRIEHKFSRYRNDNIIHHINHANGQRVCVDDETANMLDYAAQCFELSNGKFDITSGILRKVWKFDGSDRIPSQPDIDALMPLIGWHKVIWKKPELTLLPGMEIDLGGIGKEYAVDQTAALLARESDVSVLVNYGGDLFAAKPRQGNRPWLVGVDDPGHTGKQTLGRIELMRGGLTTSGDARRYLMKNGVRYSHILDPLTGWPVPDAPHAVTVLADTCLEAGMLSTFAMLQGENAEDFLRAQNVKFWCAR
jgi:thiamine biosynthesis lipoprotein